MDQVTQRNQSSKAKQDRKATKAWTDQTAIIGYNSKNRFKHLCKKLKQVSKVKEKQYKYLKINLLTKKKKKGKKCLKKKVKASLNTQIYYPHKIASPRLEWSEKKLSIYTHKTNSINIILLLL